MTNVSITHCGRSVLGIIAFMVLIFGPLNVAAQSGLDYRSVGASATIFYSAPSSLSRKVAVASRYLPVEVLVSSGEWVKIRDSSGELAWVEAKNLVPKRMLVVTSALAHMRQKPDASSVSVAQLERNVVVEFIEPAPGWIKVKHRDGPVGYLAITDVWGV